MILDDLFGYIAEIDSASLDLDTDGDGVITAANVPKVIKAINLGLLQLYMEFPIREKMVVVQLYAHITDYLLTFAYAETNTEGSEPYKYIMDTIFDPFADDILKIQSVTDEGGQELPLNTNNQIWSLFTPAHNIIQHPYPNDENAIFIAYRARHPEIAIDAVAATYDVAIPPQVLPLLLLFVHHKLVASVNQKESMEKLQEYMLQMKNISNLIMFNEESSANEKLTQNGFA